MTQKTHWLLLGFALGVLSSLAPACGPASCGPDTCAGCCDSSGLCQAGSETTACGANGLSCDRCVGAQVCSGRCVAGTPDAGTLDADAGAGDAGALVPTSPLALTAVVTPDPVRLGLNDMVVTVRGANGVPVPNATLTARTWMALHGHGSPTPTITNAGGGDYLLANVSFTMLGTWTVTVSATTPDALSGSKVFSYTVR